MSDSGRQHPGEQPAGAGGAPGFATVDQNIHLQRALQRAQAGAGAPTRANWQTSHRTTPGDHVCPIRTAGCDKSGSRVNQFRRERPKVRGALWGAGIFRRLWTQFVSRKSLDPFLRPGIFRPAASQLFRSGEFNLLGLCPFDQEFSGKPGVHHLADFCTRNPS